MTKHNLRIAFAGLLCLGFGTAAKADDYTIDPVHSGVSFQILHLGVSYIQGRFNDFSGSFTIDTGDPAKSAFSLSINTSSIDTNNSKSRRPPAEPGFLQRQTVSDDQLQEHIGQTHKRRIRGHGRPYSSR